MNSIHLLPKFIVISKKNICGNMVHPKDGDCTNVGIDSNSISWKSQIKHS